MILLVACADGIVEAQFKNAITKVLLLGIIVSAEYAVLMRLMIIKLQVSLNAITLAMSVEAIMSVGYEVAIMLPSQVQEMRQQSSLTAKTKAMLVEVVMSVAYVERILL